MYNRKFVEMGIFLAVILIAYIVIFHVIEDPNEKNESVPEPTAVATEAPSEELVIVPTEEPVLESTPVITEEPAPEPTEEPTPEPIPEPTAVPTLEPTSSEDDYFIRPPVVIIVEPTPVSPQNDYSAISTELSYLTCGGGIYSSYEDSPKYDLYDYISIQDISAPQLFDCLRQPFVNGIASLTAMQFDGSRYGTDALAYALNSSVDGNSGRVRIGNYPENVGAISTVYDQIRESGDFANANSVMLDFLYKYTIKNPANSYERLIIACN